MSNLEVLIEGLRLGRKIRDIPKSGKPEIGAVLKSMSKSLHRAASFRWAMGYGGMALIGEGLRKGAVGKVLKWLRGKGYKEKMHDRLHGFEEWQLESDSAAPGAEGVAVVYNKEEGSVTISPSTGWS
jgi:hypothetical protein